MVVISYQFLTLIIHLLLASYPSLSSNLQATNTLNPPLSKPPLQRHIKSCLTHIIICRNIQPLCKSTPIWLIIYLKRNLIIGKRIKKVKSFTLSSTLYFMLCRS